MQYLFTCVCLIICFHALQAQNLPETAPDSTIMALIDQYAQARQHRDTVLLEQILTPDVDQLVSSGEWRRGKQESMKGMLRSSARNPGGRTLTVEKIRFLDPNHAIVDTRYEIQNADGSVRKMWSTFMVVHRQDSWKISAIRNMRPSR